jgi:hypothetical protein
MSALLIFILLAALALFDRLQRREPHYRVYPILGRTAAAARWLLAALPSGSERKTPFSSAEQACIRKRAMTGSSMTAFGAMGERGAGAPSVDVALLPGTFEESFSTMVGNSSGFRIGLASLDFVGREDAPGEPIPKAG